MPNVTLGKGCCVLINGVYRQIVICCEWFIVFLMFFLSWQPPTDILTQLDGFS